MSGTTETLKLKHSDYQVKASLDTFKSDTDIWNEQPVIIESTEVKENDQNNSSLFLIDKER